LLTAVLARQAAAAMGMGTCWPWETAATLPPAWRRKALRRPRGGEERGHIVAGARLQLVLQLHTDWTNLLVGSQSLCPYYNEQ